MTMTSLKRAIAPSIGTPHKKTCLQLAPFDFENPEEEPYNASTSSSERSDDETYHNASTPLTPVSSKDSPVWPSRLKTIPCEYPLCKKTFNRPAKLTQHLRSHTNTRPFACPHVGCAKDFLRSSHLQHHVKSAHSNARDYVCQYEDCGKRFVTGTRLKRHHATHEGRKEFACTAVGCGQKFRKHNTLQKHIISVHEGGKAYVCQVLDGQGKPCGAGFDAASKLERHEKSVHSDKIYYCTICNGDVLDRTKTALTQNEPVTFPNLLALQAHIRDQHPHTCQDCGTTYRHPYELAMHVEAKHEVIEVDKRRKYPCHEAGCGRSFTQKSNLVTHIKNFHLETKTFVCGHVDPKTLTLIEDWDGSDACGRTMSTKGNLIQHIRTVHLGLEPSHKARRKQKAANAKNSAKKVTSSAMELLTGSGYEHGRKLECLVQNCNYRFQRDYDLQRHLKSYHRLAELEIQMLHTKADPFDGSCYVANAAELQADRVLSQQFGGDSGFHDYFEELEESAANGGPFWLGGEQEIDAGMMVAWEWDLMET